MEIFIVIGIAAVLLALVVAGLGSLVSGRDRPDELQSERGADEGPDEGMGASPVRDRPAGPGAEPQDPDAATSMHPPDQRGAPPDEVPPPSEAAGEKERPDDRD